MNSQTGQYVQGYGYRQSDGLNKAKTVGKCPPGNPQKTFEGLFNFREQRDPVDPCLGPWEASSGKYLLSVQGPGCSPSQGSSAVWSRGKLTYYPSFLVLCFVVAPQARAHRDLGALPSTPHRNLNETGQTSGAEILPCLLTGFAGEARRSQGHSAVSPQLSHWPQLRSASREL